MFGFIKKLFSSDDSLSDAQDLQVQLDNINDRLQELEVKTQKNDKELNGYNARLLELTAFKYFNSFCSEVVDCSKYFIEADLNGVDLIAKNKDDNKIFLVQCKNYSEIKADNLYPVIDKIENFHSSHKNNFKNFSMYPMLILNETTNLHKSFIPTLKDLNSKREHKLSFKALSIKENSLNFTLDDYKKYQDDYSIRLTDFKNNKKIRLILTGDTYPHKEVLKQLGFIFFSPKNTKFNCWTLEINMKNLNDVKLKINSLDKNLNLKLKFL